MSENKVSCFRFHFCSVECIFVEPLIMCPYGQRQDQSDALGHEFCTAKSQNGWGWNGFLEVILPNPSYAGSPRAVVYVQLDFECIQGWRLENLWARDICAWSPLEWKEFSSDQRELYVLQFVPSASNPVTGQC